MLLDATAIPVERGGVGRYVDALVEALVPLQDDRFELLVAARPADVHRFATAGADVLGAPRAIERRAVRLSWEQSGLPVLAARSKARVVHSPHYTLPLVSPARSVVTMHDATFFSDPELHLPVKARFFRSATRIAARRAGRVVVPSVATRDELTRFVGLDPAKVTVAPHGVDHELFRPPSSDEVERLRSRLGVGRYIAFLGTIEPRKNVAALVTGWVDAVLGNLDPPALVLAGAPGWDTELDAAVARVPASLRVVRPGYLPVEQLRALLGGAELVAYPSLGEGFGLPVLEAMACGAAVMTTKLLSLPEVGGDAVAYTGVSPTEIAATLAGLLADGAARQRLRTAAIERAGEFGWERCARQHIAAFLAAAR
ncbi:MAG: glycosyltransferase family 4 protein [Actinobacteria bacterium]|nr:glycosyltransferase family 4 protein [Actinomycetota bacterium]